jgi:hypothetical protein
MQLSGLLHGAKLLRFINFPVPEVLGLGDAEAEIEDHLNRGRNKDTCTPASASKHVV